MGCFLLEWRGNMVASMTLKRPASEKVAVNARIDAELIARLDELSQRQGTIHFERSRSELVGFAVREYVERHGGKKTTEKK
jgi:metal-responsive CopG/Arc/MetJ family transcriptional regulator